jgi:LysM repeat protein
MATAALSVALAIGTLTGRAGAGPGPGSVQRPASVRVHVVREGETLWGVAQRIVGPQGDPRPVVDELIRANHLADAVIRPGDRLVLSR